MGFQAEKSQDKEAGQGQAKLGLCRVLLSTACGIYLGMSDQGGCAIYVGRISGKEMCLGNRCGDRPPLETRALGSGCGGVVFLVGIPGDLSAPILLRKMQWTIPLKRSLRYMTGREIAQAG